MFGGVFQKFISQRGEKLMGARSGFVQSGPDVQKFEHFSRLFPGDGQPAVMKRLHREIFMMGTGRIIPDKSGTENMIFPVMEFALSCDRPEKFREIDRSVLFMIRRDKDEITTAAHI